MNSQLRFIMHPDDELLLLEKVLNEPSVVLINGPRWKAATPATARSLSQIGSYCIIWSPENLSELEARFIPSCNDWYCQSEHSTIQFLRSEIRGTVVTEGRFAIGTNFASPRAASGVERRFKALSKFVKKTYSNSIMRWQNPTIPFAPAGPNRSANPSKLDNSVWVGPAAIAWLRSDDQRRIKQFFASVVEGILEAPPNLAFKGDVAKATRP
jgi:hypothetical protein